MQQISMTHGKGLKPQTMTHPNTWQFIQSLVNMTINHLLVVGCLDGTPIPLAQPLVSTSQTLASNDITSARWQHHLGSFLHDGVKGSCIVHLYIDSMVHRCKRSLIPHIKMSWSWWCKRKSQKFTSQYIIHLCR